MPKSVDPDQKRAEFIAASFEVIAAEGLPAATLRRVAAAAGCTTGALTHYFAGRKSLLVDALRSAHFEAGARMAAAARANAPRLERLRAVLLEALPLDAARLREWRVWLAFWAESMNDAALAAENARRYAEWSELLEGLVDSLTSSASEKRGEVAHLIALVDGLGVRVARLGDGDPGLAEQQQACRATLARHLARFEVE